MDSSRAAAAAAGNLRAPRFCGDRCRALLCYCCCSYTTASAPFKFALCFQTTPPVVDVRQWPQQQHRPTAAPSRTPKRPSSTQGPSSPLWFARQRAALPRAAAAPRAPPPPPPLLQSPRVPLLEGGTHQPAHRPITRGRPRNGPGRCQLCLGRAFPPAAASGTGPAICVDTASRLSILKHHGAFNHLARPASYEDHRLALPADMETPAATEPVAAVAPRAFQPPGDREPYWLSTLSAFVFLKSLEIRFL
ncbi:hypothetical protein HYPSUDRAFT_210365 [Hypholoma sublateritium FD-334 SS-4]|uniref:Uncharacterized protein n=1 Tax=Hypholoma sublateritium (strain FD-334 SS-4) TaxID=945553 RepID=A0A0D2LP53_HYPSF|nr:hypothetical protein HYPSUDRAFT_210365 [Hypholoma sublateritium FD-334 SS-4]